MSKQEYKYGFYTPTDKIYNRHRVYIYESKLTGELEEDLIMILNKDDKSRVQDERTYSSMQNCHCCFASYGHTVDLCADRNKVKN